MLVIRLTRVGKKNSPAYRVVVADKRKAVKRKFIEILGHYNPASTPKQLVIDKEKSLEWISKGAQPSDTVNNLMCDLGILAKNKKVKVTYGKKTKKKDAGKETEEKVEKKEEAAAEETETAEEAVAEEVSKETAPESQEETTPETEDNEAEKTVE